MPVHNRVLQVEALHIAHCRRFELLRETKECAQLSDLGDIVLYEDVLLVRADERYVRRRAWLTYMSNCVALSNVYTRTSCVSRVRLMAVTAASFIVRRNTSRRSGENRQFLN